MADVVPELARLMLGADNPRPETRLATFLQRAGNRFPSASLDEVRRAIDLATRIDPADAVYLKYCYEQIAAGQYTRIPGDVWRAVTAQERPEVSNG